MKNWRRTRHERAQLIGAALRELGGVPDVLTPALGGATALAKTVVEQANRSPARCLVTSLWNTNIARPCPLSRGPRRHSRPRRHPKPGAAPAGCASRTIDWITSVLVEEAAGEPTKVRPTPVQKAVGQLTRVINYPVRRSAE